MLKLLIGFVARDCGHMRYLFDDPGIYAIQVAGEVAERWSERLGSMILIRSETAEEEAKPVTVLIGMLIDQAELAGVLDTLYRNHYPLLYLKYLGQPEIRCDKTEFTDIDRVQFG